VTDYRIAHALNDEVDTMKVRLCLYSMLLVMATATLAPADDLQAGAAKIDITPPTGFPMWGYGARHDKGSDGVLDPLYARAIVLAAGKQKIAIVSLDLGRAPVRDSTATIRKKVKDAAAIEHLFLVASHTHHGPVLELDTWPTAKEPYVLQLENKLIAVIGEAAKRLVPARLGVASKDVPFNRNRHTKLADKPVDREFTVVRIEDIKGQTIAHLVNFAAHATMEDYKVLKFSADFPGALATGVEKQTDAPCLYLQGACGDLSANAGEHKGPQMFGKTLAAVALEMSKSIKATVAKDTKFDGRLEHFRFGKRINLADPGIKALFNAAFFPDLVAFYEKEYQDGVRPQLTTVLLDGRIGFVGVSGEFFCTHSLVLKKRARLDHVLFLGYCNDYQQYFPTVEAAAEGGYGGDPQVSPVEVGAGERMMDRALVHLYEMRGKLKNFGEK
jgi:neutral ceramidase